MPVASCPSCGGERDEPRAKPPDESWPGGACDNPFHQAQSGDEDGRTWTLRALRKGEGREVRPRGPFVLYGPDLEPGESVEVLPVSEHEKRVAELERIAAFDWNVACAERVEHAVGERTRAIVEALRKQAIVRDGRIVTDTTEAAELNRAADFIESRFSVEGGE